MGGLNGIILFAQRLISSVGYLYLIQLSDFGEDIAKFAQTWVRVGIPTLGIFEQQDAEAADIHPRSRVVPF